MESLLQNWWFPVAAGLLCYGLFAFLYKAAAEAGMDSVAVVNVSTLTVFGLGGVLLLLRPAPAVGDPVLLLLAAGNGAFFMLGSVLKVESLKFLPASVAFSLSKLNLVFVVVIAVAVFGERPSLRQSLGIAAAAAMVAVARRRPPGAAVPELRARGRGVFLAAGAALCTSITLSLGRCAARSPLDRVLYVTLSYGLAAALAFAWNRFRGPRPRRLPPRWTLLAAGAGVLNFLGYLAVLQAFAVAPLSVVQPLFAMSILIPIALSTVFYREKLTARNLAAVGLALLAVALLKAG
ncbi:MAG TPA: EamA family transporter [bacterium]|nr:EamA family transporter [bacterium]HPQ65747.1 EamA family transporter [bacterium]